MSVPVTVKVADVSVITPPAPAVICVSGGVLSTTTARVAMAVLPA